MKGMVFTSFLEMVEERFSLEVVDKMIESSELSTGGSYTTVGTYDHQELIQLIVRLSEHTSIPVPKLVRVFGENLFSQLVEKYPELIKGVPTVFSLLEHLDGYIHMEVKKLYPEAELPSFQCEILNEHTLILTYYSARPFADLAEGLIFGSIQYYGEKIQVSREDLPANSGTSARFVLTKE